jgi:hypothetical protein
MRRRRLIQFILILLPLVLIGTVSAQTTASVPGTTNFIFDTRADLELLADAQLGEGIRPDGWTGNVDTASPSVLGDLWYDNELLADALFGAGLRPDDWAGATVASAALISRNVRHDLELSADEFYGIGQRPETWRGAAAVLRCERSLQNVLEMLNRFYRITSQTPDSALNYCLTVASEIEDQLVNIVFGTPDADGNLPDPIALLSAVRGDLERLADELLGLNTRPEGYSGSRDATSPTLIGDIFLDMTLIADTELGEGVRPDNWIGVVTSSPAISYLNLRHDLELLADTALGLNVRPNGWQGVNPLEHCNPFVRSLVFLVTENYDVTFSEIDPLAADYCQQVDTAVNAVVENPPVLDVVEEEQRFTGSSTFAFAYLDVSATEYMGIMPGGTQFRAVYRNFGNSNMMFVVGQDFALYVDRRFTTVEETTYNGLQTVENVDPVTFCDAFWCNGPGPTPTPTGSGPLISVLIQNTPQSTPNPQELEVTKQLVSWNYIRVTYVQDNVQARTAQVALEICAQPAQNATACEPVNSVFDQATGTNKPVLSQYNGLNVYEFRYGYTTNVVIEGDTRFSNDVWISDPTIR